MAVAAVAVVSLAVVAAVPSSRAAAAAAAAAAEAAAITFVALAVGHEGRGAVAIPAATLAPQRAAVAVYVVVV